MSSESPEAVRKELDRITGQEHQPNESEDIRELVESLVDEIEDEREKRRELEAEFEEFKRDIIKKVNENSARIDGSHEGSGGTPLDRKSSLPRKGREKRFERDDLGKYEFFATIVHCNWTELSWRGGEAQNNRWLVDTQRQAVTKHKPSKFKMELEREIGETLDWKTVYRVMKTVARLSAPDGEVEEFTDEYGRQHITGGEYEYHEKPTANNQEMKKVLVEVP